MKTLLSVLFSAALAGATIVIGATPAQAADNFIETSDVVACGQITITLHNVSPWIYPVSVSTDGSTPNANGPLYGPVVDNRTGGQLNGPQKDATGSKTYTFPEDSGVHIVKYVVNAGSESDLWNGKPVGTVTTRTVQSDCFPPNLIETSDDNTVCGQITISLHNRSPWVYPVSVSTDGSTPDANGPLYGPVVDNRTDGGLNGPQKDVTESKTYSFPEDSGVHTVKYVVNAGSESDLWRDLPAGTVTTRTVESDCVKSGGGDDDDDDPADAALPDTGGSTSWWQATGAAALIALGTCLVAAGRTSRGRHTLI